MGMKKTQVFIYTQNVAGSTLGEGGGVGRMFGSEVAAKCRL